MMITLLRKTLTTRIDFRFLLINKFIYNMCHLLIIIQVSKMMPKLKKKPKINGLPYSNH